MEIISSKFLSLFGILILFSFNESFGQQTQLVRIFNGPQCVGDVLQNITETGVYTPAEETAAYVSMRVTGLWDAGYCTEAAGCSESKIYYGRGACVEPLPTDGVKEFYFTRYGDPNQSEKSIMLHRDLNLKGNPVKIDTNSSIAPMLVKSYYFAGPNSWQIFSGENFTGENQCLEHMLNDLTTGFTVGLEFNFTVASVRMGCLNETSTSDSTDPIISTTPNGASDIRFINALLLFTSIVLISFVSNY